MSTPQQPNPAGSHDASGPGFGPQVGPAYHPSYSTSNDPSAPGAYPQAAPSYETPYGPPSQGYGSPSQGYAALGHAPAPSPLTGATAFGPPAGTAAAPRPQRLWRRLAAVACAAALVGGGAGAGATLLVGNDRGVVVTQGGAAQVAAVTDGTVAAAAKVIGPSVVTITASSSSQTSIGSGVIIDRDGHVLTNQHVVAGVQGGRLTVTLADGSSTTATIAGQSSEADLAVITLQKSSTLDPAALTPATFADSSGLSVGQSVVAVGAPLGLSSTVTSGVVSTLDRPVRSGLSGEAVYDAVQTDAPINPGNSGGPLVDLRGRVVGINSSIASTSDATQGQSGNIGIGFAISSDLATRVADDLVANGHASMANLGVQVSGPDSSGPQAPAGDRAGVSLTAVTAGGAAAAAGLRSGDLVTKVDDLPVTTADGLIAAIRSFAPGTRVTIGYQRDGSEQTAQATLGQADS